MFGTEPSNATSMIDKSYDNDWTINWTIKDIEKIKNMEIIEL